MIKHLILSALLAVSGTDRLAFNESPISPAQSFTDNQYTVKAALETTSGDIAIGEGQCTREKDCVVRLSGTVELNVSDWSSQYWISVYAASTDPSTALFSCCLTAEGSRYIFVQKPIHEAVIREALIYDLQTDSLTYHPPIPFGRISILMLNK